MRSVRIVWPRQSSTCETFLRMLKSCMNSAPQCSTTTSTTGSPDQDALLYTQLISMLIQTEEAFNRKRRSRSKSLSPLSNHLALQLILGHTVLIAFSTAE